MQRPREGDVEMSGEEDDEDSEELDDMDDNFLALENGIGPGDEPPETFCCVGKDALIGLLINVFILVALSIMFIIVAGNQFKFPWTVLIYRQVSILFFPVFLFISHFPRQIDDTTILYRPSERGQVLGKVVGWKGDDQIKYFFFSFFFFSPFFTHLKQISFPN